MYIDGCHFVKLIIDRFRDKCKCMLKHFCGYCKCFNHLIKIKKGDYQCDQCNFVAVKTEELKSHVEAVHRDGYYQCDKWNFAAVINK